MIGSWNDSVIQLLDKHKTRNFEIEHKFSSELLGYSLSYEIGTRPIYLFNVLLVIEVKNYNLAYPNLQFWGL